MPGGDSLHEPMGAMVLAVEDEGEMCALPGKAATEAIAKGKGVVPPSPFS